jgi:hypothetical protein
VLGLGLVVLLGLFLLDGRTPEAPPDDQSSPAPILEWTAVSAPSPAVRRASLSWSPGGYIVMGTPDAAGTALWSSVDGEDWVASRLDQSPQGITIRDDGLIVFRGHEAASLRVDSGGWIQDAAFTLPVFARSGYESGRPALVDAGGELFLHSVEGELYHQGTDGMFDLVIDKGVWWAPAADPWERFTSPLNRNACRPPFEGSLDYPPLFALGGGHLALIPLDIDGPNLTWPVCDPRAWRSVGGGQWNPTTTSGFEQGSFVYDVAVVDGVAVAVGGLGEAHPAIWTSVDGVDWSLRPWPESITPFGLAVMEVGDFGLVVIGRDVSGGNGRAWFSTDGACWHEFPPGIAPGAVAVGTDGLVVADARPDGSFWTATATGRTSDTCDVRLDEAP